MSVPTLKLYGHVISQPTRAVMQLLAVQKEAYEFVKVNPVAGDTITPEYLSKFPLGYAPAIEEVVDGQHFYLAEAGAILPYLCESRKWDQWYPTSSASTADIRRRARINECLHWHHTAFRKCTVDCFRVHMIKYMNMKGQTISPKDGNGDKNNNNNADAELAPAVQKPTEPEKGLHAAENLKFLKKLSVNIDELINNSRWTESNTTDVFMAPGDKPSIADLMTYSEIDQLDAIRTIDGLKKDKPLFNRWIEEMKKVDQHDELRKPLYKLAANMKKSGALGVEVKEEEQFFGVP